MKHYLSRLALVLAAAATAWACSKDGEEQGAETATEAQPAPSSGHMMQPGSGNTMQPGSGNMMQPGSGNTMQPGSGNTMQPGSGNMMQQMRASCPMVVKGTKVDVSNTDKGVALTFTSDAGDVSDLRAHVQHMAQMYEMHRGHGHMMWHDMGGGQGMGQGMGTGQGMGQGKGMGPHGAMPAATANVETVDNGARLVLTPSDPTELAALREHARWHAQRMQSHECWMLQGGDDTAKQPGQ